MKRIFGDSLHKWLTMLLFVVCVLSLFQWLAGAPVHTAAVITILCVWTALITAADKLWRWPGVLALTVVANLAAALLGNESEMLVYVLALFTSDTPVLSVGGDIVVLAVLSVASVAALYVLRGFWPRAVLSLAWTAFWIVAAILELAVPKLAIAAMVPILLFTLVQGLHRARKGGEGEHFTALSSGLMALFFAAGVLLMIMPISAKPYKYPIINAIWERVEKLYQSIETQLFFREEGSEQFGMSFWGYSDYAQTGDGGEGEGRDVLLANPRRTTNGRLYLAGNTWNVFTGNGWQDTVDAESGDLLDWNMDSAERIYAFWRYQENGADLATGDMLRENNVHIVYRNTNTRTLFTTSGALRITTDVERYPWQALAGRALFDYIQNRDTYYRVYYLEENPAYIKQLITASEGYEYQQESDQLWRQIYMDYRWDFVLDLSSDLLIEQMFADRSELIHNTYLDLPEEISPQVIALADEITSGCTNNYDKIVAIADYLQSNYSYTTAPEPAPAGTSFLDYMLFESKEGYCTWYATAATILARCADIPARYVQGYSVQLNGYTYNTIDWRHSHAWCEAYIDGYGWVTVEATPGYDMSGSDWTNRTEGADYGTGGAWGEQDEEEQPEDNGLTGEKSELSEQPETAEPLIIRIAVIALSGLAMVLLLVAAMRYEKRRREYENADYSGKTVIDLENLLKALARRGYRRKDNESLRKYFGRIKWSMGIEPRQVEQMAVMYEEIIFGGRELTKEEWEDCRRFAATLKKTRRN